VGAIGWFLDVFPHPKHEAVPVRPLAERAAPIRTAGRVVQILEEGHVPHRAHIPQEVHPYSVGVWAGLVPRGDGCDGLYLWPHLLRQLLVSGQSARGRRRTGMARPT